MKMLLLLVIMFFSGRALSQGSDPFGTPEPDFIVQFHQVKRKELDEIRSELVNFPFLAATGCFEKDDLVTKAKLKVTIIERVEWSEINFSYSQLPPGNRTKFLIISKEYVSRRLLGFSESFCIAGILERNPKLFVRVANAFVSVRKPQYIMFNGSFFISCFEKNGSWFFLKRDLQELDEDFNKKLESVSNKVDEAFVEAGQDPNLQINLISRQNEVKRQLLEDYQIVWQPPIDLNPALITDEGILSLERWPFIPIPNSRGQ